MEASPFATPVQQAARCLADDPSFRYVSNLEEQRAEARLLLQGIPGGDPGDADEAIMLALELASVDEGPAEIAVAKADYSAGVWKERKILVRRPKLSDPFLAEITPPAMPVTDKRLRKMGLPVRQPPRPPRKRPRGLSKTDRRKQRRVSSGTLNAFQTATGMTVESISRILDKSRPTVQLYLTGAIHWAPSKADLAKLRDILQSQQQLVEASLAEFNDLVATALPDEE